MKTITFLFFASLLTISSTFSQPDTIFRINGEKILAHVTEVSLSTIKFIYPDESFSNEITKGEIEKIHFKSGRKLEISQSLNDTPVKSCLDWENVQISKIESEVTGLKKISTITASASSQNRAFNKIKLKTALLGGNIAYIINMGYDDKHSLILISAIAYTMNKINPDNIVEGIYSVKFIYSHNKLNNLKKHYLPQQQQIEIKKDKIYRQNNFQKINLSIFSISNVENFTIIYADSSEIVLSGTYSSNSGKKTYYNILLSK